MTRSLAFCMLLCSGIFGLLGCKKTKPGEGSCVVRHPSTVKDQKGIRQKEGVEWQCQGKKWVAVRGWKAGALHGIWMEWGDSAPFQKNGETYAWSYAVKKREGVYRQGKKHGVFREWFPSGKLAEESSYENDRFHGRSVLWFRNGQKQAERFYAEGRPQGTHRDWFPNGKKKEEVVYTKNGQKKHRKMWNEHGRKVYDCNFKGERFHGYCGTWYPNGIPQSEVFFFWGTPHGAKKRWNPEGKVVQEEIVDARRNGIMAVDGEKIIEPIAWTKKHLLLQKDRDKTKKGM